MIEYLKAQLTPAAIFLAALFGLWIGLLIIAAIRNNNSLK